uniref:Uncharacterized protein n=1 Tax=Panagrolaimus superbus TaxID=310955 RepID=A0A914YTU9_9BILA
MDPSSIKQNNRTIYILESPEISLSNTTLLSFDLYRRSSAIMLQICLDSLTNCPYESPKLDSKVFWREGESILLPTKTKKVYFVATQWKRFKWLAIDNIVLNKGLGCKGREAAASAAAAGTPNSNSNSSKIEEIRKFFRKQRIEN